MSFAKNIEKTYSLREKCPNSEFSSQENFLLDIRSSFQVRIRTLSREVAINLL